VYFSENLKTTKTFVISTTKIEDKRYQYLKTFTFTKGFYANAKETHPPLNYSVSDWKIPYCDRYLNEKFCSGVIPIQYHKASLDLYLYNYIEN
jgi:hypothetical protein